MVDPRCNRLARYLNYLFLMYHVQHFVIVHHAVHPKKNNRKHKDNHAKSARGTNTQRHIAHQGNGTCHIKATAHRTSRQRHMAHKGNGAVGLASQTMLVHRLGQAFERRPFVRCLQDRVTPTTVQRQLALNTQHRLQTRLQTSRAILQD